MSSLNVSGFLLCIRTAPAPQIKQTVSDILHRKFARNLQWQKCKKHFAAHQLPVNSRYGGFDILCGGHCIAAHTQPTTRQARRIHGPPLTRPRWRIRPHKHAGPAAHDPPLTRPAANTIRLAHTACSTYGLPAAHTRPPVGSQMERMRHHHVNERSFVPESGNYSREVGTV